MMITFKSFTDHLWHILTALNHWSPDTAQKTDLATTEGHRLEQPVAGIQSYIKKYCHLPLQECALVALRSACHTKGANSHFTDLIPTAKDYGLSNNDIHAVTQPFHPYGWSKQQQLLLFITDEWHLNGSVRMPLWEKLEAQYTKEQIFCLVLCAAQGYLLVSP
ncbi:hypothetical protein CI610_00671 [invertebrate metagenome]|uniref:Uncharacterized protein n=1 Tax=invertebrate metagenome TaxID=1711999 RepID=A0A2H9TB38_9ZZZZ